MVPILIFCLILLGLLVRYVQLRVQLSRTQDDWFACRENLMAFGQEFAKYAFSHSGHLPERLDVFSEVIPEASCSYVYRYVPELELDNRLILLYEKSPQHAMMAFPKLVFGCHVLFANGKVELFEEGVVHQLIVGDNVLRERLGLPEIPFMEVWDGGE